MAASDDPGTLVNAAVALAYFGEDLGAMLALNRGRPSCGAWLDKRAVVSASGF
jgi:hypothetical protein